MFEPSIVLLHFLWYILMVLLGIMSSMVHFDGALLVTLSSMVHFDGTSCHNVKYGTF